MRVLFPHNSNSGVSDKQPCETFPLDFIDSMFPAVIVESTNKTEEIINLTTP